TGVDSGATQVNTSTSDFLFMTPRGPAMTADTQAPDADAVLAAVRALRGLLDDPDPGRSLKAAVEIVRLECARLARGKPGRRRRTAKSHPRRPQPQGVGDYRYRTQAHRRRGDHRAEQQAEDRVEHPGRDRH